MSSYISDINKPRHWNNIRNRSKSPSQYKKANLSMSQILNESLLNRTQQAYLDRGIVYTPNINSVNEMNGVNA